MTVKRFDVGRLDNVKRVPGGGIRVPAFLTRTGIFEYRRSDGSISRELRAPEEVFKADSLASLAFAPVTDLHPPDMVKPDNWKSYSVGFVAGEPKQDGNFVSSELVIQDKQTIDKVDAGERKEVSLGYECDLENKPGQYDGKHYDSVQRNIKYNHVAIGPTNWGRAGSSVALRLDSKDDAVCYYEDSIKDNKEQKKMAKRLTLDGIPYDVESEAFDIAYKKHEDGLNGIVTTLKSENETLKGKLDASEKEVKSLKDKQASQPADLDKLINDRVKLRTDAGKVLGSEFKFDGKTDRDIMVDTIKKTDDSFTGKDMSDEYVKGRFDHVVASHKSDSNNANADLNRTTKHDSKGNMSDLVEAARKKNIDDNRNEWQKPLSASRDNVATK